jgi:hypothetical protein
MTAMGMTLLADGSSDVCLAPIIEWTVRQNAPDLGFRLEIACQHLPPLRDGLRSRIIAALKFFPCHILLVHRDAEAVPRAARVAEIVRESNGIAVPGLIPIVPVRMSEAWLLSDIAAIRRAANNPNGNDEVDLGSDWEALTDPKDTLFRALRCATGLGARRRERFDVNRARIRVAQLTEHFGRLRNIESFREFEQDLRTALQSLR